MEQMAVSSANDHTTDACRRLASEIERLKNDGKRTVKLTPAPGDPAKPEQAPKVRLRMESFDPPIICALGFVALFWWGLWGPEWLRPPMQM